MKRKKMLAAIIISGILTLSIGGILVGAATKSPWVTKKSKFFSNEVITTFTPDWKTTKDDAKFHVMKGRYIRNSWCKVTEGNRTDYNKSSDYKRPKTTWVYTEAKLFDSPFYKAKMSYGWGYQ